MRCAGPVLLALFFVPGLFRPFGCESVNDSTVSTNPVSATSSDEAPDNPLPGSSDDLYGAEPLVRPLRLDGDPLLAGGT